VSTERRSTRATILDAANRLITERGPAVPLEEIADEAGVSRQTLYVHFGSRSGLLLGLVQHADTSGVLQQLIQRVLAAPSAAHALDAVADLHAEYSPIAYPIARVIMVGRHDDEALRVAWDDRMQARRGLYREVVERAAREDVLASEWTVESATEVMFALTSWQVWEQLVIDQHWSDGDYRVRLASTLRRTLLSRP
jgi:AcrR family transcriptional regulator